jgi:Fe2+ transport system protein FeoA
MSPLALLQEGEIAEIVDPQKNEFIAHRHGHHRRRQGDTVSISPENHRVNRHFACGISSSNHLCLLQDMGLRPGKKVEMITNTGSGPLVLLVDECRIAIGRGAAMKIYVRRNGQ